MNQKKILEKEIKKIYISKKKEIFSRCDEFKKIWENGTENDIFIELIFCILTPQSKAKSCWLAVQNIQKKNLLLNGYKNKIVKELNIVRFKNKKAEYIIRARNQFYCNDEISIKNKIMQFDNIYEIREWIVKNIKGIGYKEASHFLRNIGLGGNLAIIDRHILKNLHYAGIIKKTSASITKSSYFNIEKKMQEFAGEINVPMKYLDLILWYKETGEIFK